MPRSKRKPLPRWIIFSTSIIGIGLIIALAGGMWWWANRAQRVTDYDSCAKAGYPILESFPEQCRTPDGRLFVRQLTEDEKKNSTPPDSYYGSSTNAVCKINSDCKPMGCNSEICGGKDEGLSSICVVPNQPLPQDLGYACSCVVDQCQWKR